MPSNSLPQPQPGTEDLDVHLKWTSAASQAFALLLLTTSSDAGRFQFVIKGLKRCGTPNSTRYPFVIRQGLSLQDAIAGQLALACCDCATAFVRDDVISEMKPADVADLFVEVLSSREFMSVNVRILSIPNSAEGSQLLWQFFGRAVGVQADTTHPMMLKKARWLAHCAEAIGGMIDVSGRARAQRK